jgi:hypothetical protein
MIHRTHQRLVGGHHLRQLEIGGTARIEVGAHRHDHIVREPGADAACRSVEKNRRR